MGKKLFLIGSGRVYGLGFPRQEVDVEAEGREDLYKDTTGGRKPGKKGGGRSGTDWQGQIVDE